MTAVDSPLAPAGATPVAAPRARGALAAALLAALAPGAPLGGSELARRFGVTRAAIWKQVERLRADGAPVVAQPGGGYRLTHPLDLLDASVIRAGMTPAERARLSTLEVHWQLDSTSSALLRRPPPTGADGQIEACLAEIQSAGRGRRGRAWQLPLGGGLALSLRRGFEGGMASLAGLSLVAGLAAREALADCGIDGIGLKWPNDLVAGGAKLGGILVEAGGEAHGPCHAVVGIGINVRVPAASLAGVDQPWTDLARLAGGSAPSRNYMAARLLASLAAAFERFAAQGFAPFALDWAAHDVLQGRAVRVQRGSTGGHGIAEGVDERGALRVRFDDGVRTVDSGDVSVRADP
jgi:BirA family biotin operon repressor/biotin-[acetyl-CoA-carboxylase] ligase